MKNEEERLAEDQKSVVETSSNKEEVKDSQEVKTETEMSSPVLEKTSDKLEKPTSSSFIGNYSDETEVEKSKIIPKWNWGAFALAIPFAVAHRVYLGFLILLTGIPWVGWIFGIVWSIIFGFFGEKWALENPKNSYRDEEEFRKIMDGWNRAGLISFIVGLVAIIVFFLAIIFILTLYNHDNIYQNFRPYHDDAL